MAVMARHINMSFEIAQDKSQQFLAHSEEKRGADTVLERQKKHSRSVTVYDHTQRKQKDDM